MSLLNSILQGLTGNSSDTSSVEHPCSNCPSNCSIAPNACSVCQPYKEQMIDAIYNVEHRNEITAKYEVTGTSAAEGSVVCPHCGGQSENHYICDYCGSKLQEGSGKIQVASAADIPNPVLDAQDIIFNRYEAVSGFTGSNSAYGFADALSGIGSEGLLSSILSALTGSAASSDSKSIGNKMTEDEIEEMAAYYNVSVSEYLTGLDNGKYLTLSHKTAYVNAENSYNVGRSSSSFGRTAAGIAGAAGAAGLAGALFGGSSRTATHNPPPPANGRMMGGMGQPDRRDNDRRMMEPGFDNRNGMPGRDMGRPSAPARQTQAPRPSAPARQTQAPRPSAPARQTQAPRPSAPARQTQASRPSAPSRQAQGSRPSAPPRRGGMGGPGGPGGIR